MLAFNRSLANGSDTASAAAAAFTTALAPWQGWVIRTSCRAALRLVPSRRAFLKVIAGPAAGDGTEQEKDAEARAVAALRALNSGGFTAVVEGMDAWFDGEGLNYDDKA